jgi:hypothetical protein
LLAIDHPAKPIIATARNGIGIHGWAILERHFFGGRPIAAAPLAVRAPLFELSTTNCTPRFRFLHLQKICRKIFPLG